MKIDLKFQQEDVISYFERNTVSAIYSGFYAQSHAGSVLGGHFHTSDWIKVKLASMGNNEEETEALRDIRDNGNFELKLVGSPEYEADTRRISDIVGEATKPYLEEYKLYGEYTRTLDVTLMTVYGIATRDCPPEIRELLHNDKKEGDDRQRVERFVEYMEDHPEKNQFELPDLLRTRLLPTLYDRITALADFYNQGREASLTIDEIDIDFGRYRGDFFSCLNLTFKQPCD
jgi:hypothetical protein